MLVDSDKLIVIRSTHDGTIYVLRPPGADPAAILHVARLVLPEGPYGELCLSASDLGDVLQAGSLGVNFSLDCGSISRTDYEERAR